MKRRDNRVSHAGEKIRLHGEVLINGLVAFVFAATGPPAIILTVGDQAGLTQNEIASWIFGSYVVGGLISLLFSLFYRQPLAFAWSIPGAVLIGPALGHLAFSEVIGAFVVTGVLILVLGLSGWVKRSMRRLPVPIVMGMAAGIFLRFGLDLVHAFLENSWLAGAMTFVFLGLSAAPSIAARFPPLLGAVGVGVGVLWLTEGSVFGPHQFALQAPDFYIPVFSLQAIVELVVPLTISVIVVMNGQGFTILETRGHQPPVNTATTACGVGSLLAAVTGSVSICVAGPLNAFISQSGDLHRRYVAGVLFGVLMVVYGVFSSITARLLLDLSDVFVAVLAGLAMLRVLEMAFVEAFRGRFTFGALVAFLITSSEITVFNIGAAFWGLVVGIVVSWFLESKDFRWLDQ